ncbi:MAG: thiamine-phosphate kinase [Bryobacteraceae bacterium]|nr:thiamine-phosphate kinase [Bryobacteraceae bacterium]
MTELALVAALAKRLPRIGDDCAIVPHGPEDLLFTTDLLVEDVHFRRAERTAADVGYRALARSLSDIAAMGGEPRWATVALALPPWATGRWVAGFYDGLIALAAQHRTEVVGGDFSRALALTADVMVCGTAPKGQALRRDRARPGDLIYVSGPLGRGKWRFPPRLALGQQLRKLGATSCMDLSDGLSLDLHRLAVASRVAADLHTVPLARGASLSDGLHRGEDYELLFTLPPGAKPPRLTHAIGRILRGQPGLVTYNGGQVTPDGHDHFRSQPHPRTP